jgi:hypothetical protein
MESWVAIVTSRSILNLHAGQMHGAAALAQPLRREEEQNSAPENDLLTPRA